MKVESRVSSARTGPSPLCLWTHSLVLAIYCLSQSRFAASSLTNSHFSYRSLPDMILSIWKQLPWPYHQHINVQQSVSENTNYMTPPCEDTKLRNSAIAYLPRYLQPGIRCNHPKLALFAITPLLPGETRPLDLNKQANDRLLICPVPVDITREFGKEIRSAIKPSSALNKLCIYL